MLCTWLIQLAYPRRWYVVTVQPSVRRTVHWVIEHGNTFWTVRRTRIVVACLPNFLHYMCNNRDLN